MGASKQCPDMVGGRMESASVERVPPPRAQAGRARPRTRRSGSRADSVGSQVRGDRGVRQSLQGGRFLKGWARAVGAGRPPPAPPLPAPSLSGGEGRRRSDEWPGPGGGRTPSPPAALRPGPQKDRHSPASAWEASRQAVPAPPGGPSTPQRLARVTRPVGEPEISYELREGRKRKKCHQSDVSATMGGINSCWVCCPFYFNKMLRGEITKEKGEG